MNWKKVSEKEFDEFLERFENLKKDYNRIFEPPRWIYYSSGEPIAQFDECGYLVREEK